MNLTKLLESPTRVKSEFTNRYDTDAAYLLPPWWVTKNQTAQSSPYSFRIEEATEQDLLEDGNQCDRLTY